MRKIFILTGIFTGFMLAGILLASRRALPARSAESRLYIINMLSEDISVIDMRSDEVVSTIPIAGQGYNIALSPDGTSAYVTASGDSHTQHAVNSPRLKTIDMTAQAISAQFPLPISPLARISVAPDGKTAYIVTAGAAGKRNEDRGRVLFINLANGATLNTVQVGLNPLDSVMTPDGKKMYTADWASRSISVVDLSTARLQDTIPLGVNSTRSLAMRADGKKLYTILESPPQLAAGAMVQQNYSNVAQNLMAPTSNANIANNAAETRQQVVAPDDNLLCEIDTTDGRIEKYPFSGINPVYAMTLSPDNTVLYAYGREPLINYSGPQNIPAPQQSTGVRYNVYVVDLQQKQIIKRLGNFGYLSSLVVSADGKKLYLIGTPGDAVKEANIQARYQSSLSNTRHGPPQKDQMLQDLRQVQKTVTVVDAQTGKILKRITIGNLPQGFAVQQGAK